jgi:hypothetical protein
MPIGFLTGLGRVKNTLRRAVLLPCRLETFARREEGRLETVLDVAA